MRCDLDWIMERVEMIPFSGCWIWMKGDIAEGYGVLWYEGKSYRVHRFIWELVKGPIPEGIHVLHTCDVPPCCNPYHLFLGTDMDNVHDAMNKSRWHAEGELNSKAKLTEEQVTAIYTSKERIRILAERYGVSKATISGIKSGNRWTHLIKHRS